MNGTLQLKMLGTLEVSREGAILPLPQSRKTRALLGYLALTGRPHSRDRLVSLFWDIPDDPRGALRWSLSKLRGVLDDDDRLRVRADRDAVTLDAADVDIDFARLRRMATTGFQDVPTDKLLEAVATFDGDLMSGLDLPDCQEYQFWLVAEREGAASLKARVHRELAERFADEPARALPHARAVLDFDPYNEDAHAALIDRLKMAGRRQDAEEQYRRALSELEQDGNRATRLREAWSRSEGRGPVRAATLPSELPGGGSEAREVAADELAATKLDHDQPSPTAAPMGNVAASTPATAEIMRRPAVAVLPFDNMTVEPDEDYFADGITDDVITALSQWRLFPIIARASTRIYRGRHVQAGIVGRELGARYIVQGSVRRSGSRVRVIAQLVDAETGLTLWAQRFDSEVEDVFELQDHIAQQIVVEIEPELARAERARAERVAPKRLDVWTLNLRAIDHIYKGTPNDLKAAHDILDRSLALAPESSYTHSLLAYCIYHQALFALPTSDPTSHAANFLEVSRRAVELDDNNWLGHALLGMAVLWGLRDYATAESEEQRAVLLNPTAALAHQFNGCVYSFSGQPEAAIPYLATALRLNPGPVSATLLLSDMSLAHLLIGDLDQAVTYARRAISKFNGNSRAWERLTAALGLQGRIDEAEACLETMSGMSRAPKRAYLETTYPFRDPTHRETLMNGLAAAGLDI